MKDGITLGTGNSRYLKSIQNFLQQYPTYTAFVQALVEGTLPVDFNGINEAGWQQLPSWFNKANILPNDVAESLKLVLENDPQIKDAFSNLAATLHPGNIQISNADLATLYPDIYLKCDGSLKSINNYPELYSVLGLKYGGGISDSFYSLYYNNPPPKSGSVAYPSNSPKIFVQCSATNDYDSYYSPDAGNSWIAGDSLGATVGAINSIACNSNGTVILFTCSRGNYFYMCNDGMLASWNQQASSVIGLPSGVTYYFDDVQFDFVSNRFCFVASTTSTPASYFVKSTDANATAYEFYKISDESLRNCKFYSRGNNVVVATDEKAFYSADGGETWTQSQINYISGDSSMRLRSITSCDGERYYLSATSSTTSKYIIYESIDHGKTFHNFEIPVDLEGETSITPISFDDYLLFSVRASSPDSMIYLLFYSGGYGSIDNSDLRINTNTFYRVSDDYGYSQSAASSSVFKIESVPLSSFALPTGDSTVGDTFIVY